MLWNPFVLGLAVCCFPAVLLADVMTNTSLSLTQVSASTGFVQLFSSICAKQIMFA